MAAEVKVGDRVVYRSTMRELWPAEVTHVHPSGLVDIQLLNTGAGDSVVRRDVTTCSNDTDAGCLLSTARVEAK